MFEAWGRKWECLRGYGGTTRDGWWFDLRDLTDDPDGEIVLFAFRPDGSDVLTVSQHREGLSKEILDWFMTQAEVATGPLGD
jgi:hypothetical protein